MWKWFVLLGATHSGCVSDRLVMCEESLKAERLERELCEAQKMPELEFGVEPCAEPDVE